MRVGVVKEIKKDEYRVALTPAGARELVLEADGDMHEIVLKLDFEAKAWKRVRRKVKPS
jgi:alanine dehydrogenase